MSLVRLVSTHADFFTCGHMSPYVPIALGISVHVQSFSPHSLFSPKCFQSFFIVRMSSWRSTSISQADESQEGLGLMAASQDWERPAGEPV